MVLHSFWNLTHIDIGARTDHILTGRLRPPRANRTNPNQSAADLQVLMDRIASLPGVLNVALASALPLEGHDSFRFTIAGRPQRSNESLVADLEVVSPSYFKTFGVQLLKGRKLSDSDRENSPRVIMVSQSFVDRYLQGVDPLEQRLLLPIRNPGEKVETQMSWQIVGVFHDVVNGQHLTDKASPEMFVPAWQMPIGWADELAVRTSSEPGTMTRSIRAAAAKAMPGCTLVDINDMQQSIEQSELGGDRFGAVLFTGFAALALLLAAVGIYGVMSFTVAQRTPEIALRMALGARHEDVIRLIMMDGMKLAFGGVAVGLGGVLLVGRLLRSALYQTSMVDPGSFIAVASVLVGVALFATYLPARRSTKIDPILNLRSD
jgi:putative ABC transport system permease protein